MVCELAADRLTVSTALVVPLLPSTTLTSLIASTGAASSSRIVTTPWPSLIVALVAAVRFTRVVLSGLSRSGERRGGEEGRSRWGADHLKKKKKKKAKCRDKKEEENR